MELYDIETAKGICRCTEIKGVYHCLYESESDKFLFEPILNIEIVREKEDADI
jgi:hypothetical protein